MKNIFIVLLLAFSFVLHAQSKTIVISAVTDLKGETYVVPKGSVMKFIGQGLIKNGSIVFDETTLVNPCFEAMSSYKGTITNSKLESKRFGCNNDTALLYFLLNQNRSGITISLEKRRYMIDTPPGDVKYLSALSEFNNLSDITILGNGAEICDQTVPDRVNGKYRIFLKFISCSNVTITDITYTWMYEAVIAPKVIRGMVFIQTFDECRNFNIDIAVNNAASAFESGAWNYTSGHAGRGICDSKIKILAYKVGYPIAIERGDRLDIKNYFELVHRGCYLAGVTNTRVLCKGKDAYGTSCNLLLTDTMDADGWYMSDNIRAISIDTGSKKNRKNVDLTAIQFYDREKYDQFADRSTYDVKNIRIKVKTPEHNDSIFYRPVLFCNSNKDYKQDRINLYVEGCMSDNSKNELFHFWGVTPAGDITLNGFQRGVNNIVCHHDIPQYCNVNFVKCHNIVFKPEFDETKSTAKLVFKKCTFKEIIESSKDNVVICPK